MTNEMTILGTILYDLLLQISGSNLVSPPLPANTAFSYGGMRDTRNDPISRYLYIAKIIVRVGISSWNFVPVPKAMLGTKIQLAWAWNFHHKYDIWYCIFSREHFGELAKCARISETTPGASRFWATVVRGLSMSLINSPSVPRYAKWGSD